MNARNFRTLLCGGIVGMAVVSGTAHAECRDDAYHSRVAIAALNKIIPYTGLSATTIRVMATYETDNAEAGICDNIRHIYVNESFMSSFLDNWSNDWESLSILAHEIGHHASGHAISGGYSHKHELEADRYSGHLLFRMGATLSQAVSLFEKLPLEPSRTHPGRADRLAAVRSGWNTAKGNSLQQRPGSPSPAVSQRILSGEVFPELKQYLVRGQRIDAVAYGSVEDPDSPRGLFKWYVAMGPSSDTSWSWQQCHISEAFPSEDIEEAWDEGLLLDELLYLNDRWVMVMTRPVVPEQVRQRYLTRSIFPEDEIEQGWNDDLRISSLSYGSGIWALVMDDREPYAQRWRRSNSFPEDDIRLGWDDGYEITNISWTGDEWVVVMTESPEEPYQEYFRRKYFPEEKIDELAFAGYRVTDLSYRDGWWFVVMTK